MKMEQRGEENKEISKEDLSAGWGENPTQTIAYITYRQFPRTAFFLYIFHFSHSTFSKSLPQFQ